MGFGVSFQDSSLPCLRKPAEHTNAHALVILQMGSLHCEVPFLGTISRLNPIFQPPTWTLKLVVMAEFKYEQGEYSSEKKIFSVSLIHHLESQAKKGTRHHKTGRVSISDTAVETKQHSYVKCRSTDAPRKLDAFVVIDLIILLILGSLKLSQPPFFENYFVSSFYQSLLI